jgi:hypothetical protein
MCTYWERKYEIILNEDSLVSIEIGRLIRYSSFTEQPPAMLGWQGHHIADAITKMAELNSSLTAMDWLPKLTVGGAMANANGCDTMGNGIQKSSLRKSPGSPVNPYATLTEQEAREHQLRENKPPYSYANLITFAINSSESKKMTLSEIYQWICINFPYYREAGSGWKVRISRLKLYNIYCELARTQYTNSSSAVKYIISE